MAMTGAERQKAYKERRRAEAEAGLPPEAPRKRYELAYGADGTVIAWKAAREPSVDARERGWGRGVLGSLCRGRWRASGAPGGG